MEIENNFVPATGIIGIALTETPIRGTTPGWVQLNGLKFISDISSVAPVEPYIKGVQDEVGRFYPEKPYKIAGKLGI